MFRLFSLTALRRWWRGSLHSKLLAPIAGLMLVSVLGGVAAFVGGTTLTRDRLLRQQVAADEAQVSRALTARVAAVSDAAAVLAHDPQILTALRGDVAGGGAALAELEKLNGRAVLVRNRFDLDLVQIYNRHGVARTNLVLSTLYRETGLLDQSVAGTPVVRVVGEGPDRRVLLLSRADMPDSMGVVVTGVDMETELRRLATHYRLLTEPGLVIPGAQIGFDPAAGGGYYIRRVLLILGRTPVDLVLARPVHEVTQIVNMGLAVMVISMGITTLLLIRLSVVVTRSITHPIQHLSAAAEAVSTGDLTQRLDFTALPSPLGIGQGDEIGRLAESFNAMVADLRSLYDELEARVEARTRELAAVAEVARVVSSNLDLEAVWRDLLQPIYERLGLCELALFLVEPNSDRAVIRAAIGPAGERLAQQGFWFAIGAKSILGSAAATGQPRVIERVPLEPVHVKIHEFPNNGAAAAVPLLAGQNVVGVLYAQHEQPAAFTPDLVKLLVTLADQIAVGVENTRLYQTEHRRRQLAELLELTGRTLSSSLDLEEVPERVLSLLDALVPYERGLLLLRKGDVLKPLAHYGFPDGDMAGQMEAPITPDGVFQRIVKLRGPLIVDDVTREPGWWQAPWLPVHHSWMGIPIIARDEVIGMVSLTRQERAAFSLEDTVWVQAFAMQAGIALENASLYAEIAQFNEHLERVVQERTEQLHQAYQALERLDKTKSDFIQIAAHELRTPLTVIKTSAYLVRQLTHAEATPHLQQALDGIGSGVDRLHKIVNSMLDVAKLDSQSMELCKAEMRLDQIIERVQRAYEPALVERKLSLTTSGLHELPKIYADPDLLYKLFDHLIVNAIKYTPDGGRIHIAGQAYLPGTSGNGHPPCVEIIVSDTGVGIAPQHQELIFEKFYQTGEVKLHSSGETKFNGGGPGLGLTIARGIVQAHGGQIWAESEGHDRERCPGSRFHVRLPLQG